MSCLSVFHNEPDCLAAKLPPEEWCEACGQNVDLTAHPDANLPRCGVKRGQYRLMPRKGGVAKVVYIARVHLETEPTRRWVAVIWGDDHGYMNRSCTTVKGWKKMSP